MRRARLCRPDSRRREGDAESLLESEIARRVSPQASKERHGQPVSAGDREVGVCTARAKHSPTKFVTAMAPIPRETTPM